VVNPERAGLEELAQDRVGPWPSSPAVAWTRMFHDAGFTSVEERPAPTQDPINTIYLCNP